MINIHKQLWAVKASHRPVEDSEQLLAYMTHREYTKTKEPAQSFLKRTETGKSWARIEEGDPSNILEFDNTPAKGFRIVGSVSRWSTANKLIRVEDPRGFVVEIPTGNLTTLIKHTTIDHAEVMEECVWGREGNNHILLPINSEEYKKAADQTRENSEKVALSKLTPGQTVKFSVEGNEYIYLGRGKAVWEIVQKKAQTRAWGGHYRASIEDPVVAEGVEVVDPKLGYLFRLSDPDGDWLDWEYKISGKAVITGVTEEVPDDIRAFYVCLPERAKPEGFVRSYKCHTTGGWYNTYKTARFEMKESR